MEDNRALSRPHDKMQLNLMASSCLLVLEVKWELMVDRDLVNEVLNLVGLFALQIEVLLSVLGYPSNSTSNLKAYVIRLSKLSSSLIDWGVFGGTYLVIHI